jgi:hypothetical protein
MADVDQRIALALAQLDSAAGSLLHADWDHHSSAIAEATEALGHVYLHIDAVTGEFDAGPIWKDPSRVLLGDLPATVAPLVELLERQTAQIEASTADKSIFSEPHILPPAEVAAWGRWKARLQHYRAVLDEEFAKGEFTKSVRLYAEVTGPLVSGVYPSSWEQFGIFAHYGKPDATTPATTVFMMALQYDLVSPFHRWVADWGSDVSAFVEAMKRKVTEVIAALGEGAVEGVQTAGRWIFGGLLLAGAIWGAVKLHETRSKR